MTLIFLALSAWAATPVPSGSNPAGPSPTSSPVDAVQVDWFRQAVLAHESELLAIVQKQDPSYYQKLLKLKSVDDSAYLAALYKVSKMVEKASEDPAYAERLKQIHDKEQQVRALAAGYASLPPTQQFARRAALVELVGELMDLKQTERRARLAELQQRLDDLQKEIDQREAERPTAVEQYVDQLLRSQTSP